MTIQIENKILRKADLRLATSSFLTVGAIGVGVVTNIGLVSLAAIAFPFMLDSFLTRIRLKNCDPFALDGGILSESYKKMFRNWFEKYVSDSENITEKKYKVICTNLWLRHKRLNGQVRLDDCDGFLEKLSYELRDNKETNGFLYAIFNPHIKNETHPIDFILEDEKKHINQKIAKKVYAEFSHTGMAGQAFLWGGKDFEALMELQDYKLTNEDISVIDKYITRIKKDSLEKGFLVSNARIPWNDKDILYKIVENEFETKKLKTIQQLCEISSVDVYKMSKREHEELIEFIGKKIQAINLKEGLVKDLPTDSVQTIKRNKI